MNNTAQRWSMVFIYSLTCPTLGLKFWCSWFAEGNKINACRILKSIFFVKEKWKVEVFHFVDLIFKEQLWGGWDPKTQILQSLLSRCVCYKPLWSYDISDVGSLKSATQLMHSFSGVLKNKITRDMHMCLQMCLLPLPLPYRPFSLLHLKEPRPTVGPGRKGILRGLSPSEKNQQ